MTQAGTHSRGKIGCLVALAAAVLVGSFAAVVVAVAVRQMGDDAPEVHRIENEPSPLRQTESPRAAGHVRLDVDYAQLVVTPAPAGEPIRVEADYDPRYYALDHGSEDRPDGSWVYTVRFAPTQSRALALLKIKLGARPPVVRVTLPVDLPVELGGEVHGTYAALELAGLRVSGLDMVVSGGAATVSFLEPLAAPMDRFVLRGNKGSVEVTGLGNASPREAELEQRFGEIDLDLRGAWVNDSDIRLTASFAGGGVWLPDDVVIEGIDDRIDRRRTDPVEEVPAPRLRITASDRSGGLIFVD